MSEDELGHPDSMIRLASAVHRFRCPEIGKEKNLSFEKAFKTSGSHPKTKALTSQADSCRKSLAKALAGTEKSGTVSYKTIVSASQNYLPLIHQILVTCRVQPEMARLDERLVFEWASGIEKTKKFFKSEALMYEMVMVLASEAMGAAGSACDECISGDFTTASRGFTKAAGMMRFLSEDQLPKWIARGNAIDEADLPAEATVGLCESMKVLFLAVAQQMAVATVLVKPGVPNYSLLSKLTLSIAEQFDMFMSSISSKASNQKSKMDADFFKLMALQIPLQRSLSLYFQARSVWDQKDKFGLAIALLKEAISKLKTRSKPTGDGLPEIEAKSSLKSLKNDLLDMTAHMNKVLRAWEKDNGSVYFDRVPPFVPEDAKLTNGIAITKPEPYTLVDVEPAPLSLPSAMTGMAPPPFPSSMPPPPAYPSAPPPAYNDDEALARELQRKLNAGENI